MYASQNKYFFYPFLMQIIQEFILGEFDQEITTAFHQNQSDISTLKDPRSRDASQRYYSL